jgi:hypothetical protein
VVRALVQLGVAEQDVDPGRQQPLRPQAKRRADGQPEAVPERARADLDAGHQRPVRVVAEPAVRAGQIVQPLLREEALGRQDRVERHRAVALGQQEPVPVRIVRVRRVDPQDPVVQHPQHVERGEGAGLVLLVAGHPPQQRLQPGRLARCHHRHAYSLQLKADFTSRAL